LFLLAGVTNQKGEVAFTKAFLVCDPDGHVWSVAERQAFMSREESNHRAAATPGHELEPLYHEPISYGEPLMFLLDESRLQEYLRLELHRLNKLDQRLSSAGKQIG
jgi:hypothetical protein